MRNLIFAVIFAVTISLLLGLPALLIAPRADASEESEVKKLTQEKIKIVIDVLRNKEIGKEEKKKRIMAAVDPIFDFKQMARLSLPKKHWSGMNKAQKKEFSKLFVQRLKESYLDKLELYTDEEVVIEDAKRVKKRIHVLTRLVSKDDK
jgi:phospholipid transport system substrate-binding protein